MKARLGCASALPYQLTAAAPHVRFEVSSGRHWIAGRRRVAGRRSPMKRLDDPIASSASKPSHTTCSSFPSSCWYCLPPSSTFVCTDELDLAGSSEPRNHLSGMSARNRAFTASCELDLVIAVVASLAETLESSPVRAPASPCLAQRSSITNDRRLEVPSMSTRPSLVVAPPRVSGRGVSCRNVLG